VFARKYLLRFPSFIDATCQSCVRNSKSSCPFSQTKSFAIERQHACFASVLALLELCRPSAVFGKVSEVVIDSIYCGFWKWFWSYVFKKSVEAVSPFFANRDSSFGVQVLVFVVWVASSFHFLPGSVLGSFASTSCSGSVASARLYASFSKCCPVNDGCVSALAPAKPTRVSAFRFASELDDRQLEVSVSDFICAMLAAAARFGRPRSYSTTVQYFFSSAYASKCPVCSCLASEVCAGIANCGQVVKLLSRDVFDAGTSCCRIVFSHLSLLLRSMVVRAVWKYHVPNGSLYLSM